MLEDATTRDPVYHLFGVVNHSGYLNGGHYTAYQYQMYLIESVLVKMIIDGTGSMTANSQKHKSIIVVVVVRILIFFSTLKTQFSINE